ncbi:MAG: NgoFVII family restriction endonuclease [Elusimicrobiota bacterium]|nr:NgoFVII family restriction endonuclease [Elusimicrobiota bacterium]
MLYTDNLQQLINTTPRGATKLIVLSGYVGVAPISQVINLGLELEIISGMVPTDKIVMNLHRALVAQARGNPHLAIHYTQTRAVHSKCYVWRNSLNHTVHAYIGSANFTRSGLYTPDKEILTDVRQQDFQTLDAYLDRIRPDCIPCDQAPTHLIKQVAAPRQGRPTHPIPATYGLTVRMSLLDRHGRVHDGAGINWGHANANVNRDDAYVPIPKALVADYPGFFTPVPPGRRRGSSIPLDFTWDDGFVMNGLAEGSQEYARQTYPKQLASWPRKDILGKYLRDRMGIPHGQKVVSADFRRYGRDHLDITLTGPNSYHLDFHV